MIANVLSIAGSDPSGGAGIQADLKAFSANGAYGAAALTALTAQNTRGVSGLHLVPADFVAQQIDDVFADLRIDAVKIGMLANAEIAGRVADRLRAHRPTWVVLDPVMVAKSGDRLLDEAAVATLRDDLLPLAGLITPNLPEAALLAGMDTPADIAGMRRVGEKLMELGPAAVLVKGGHLAGDASPDLLIAPRHATSSGPSRGANGRVNGGAMDGGDVIEIAAPRIATSNTHGTGCTLSSAIAAHLGRGQALPEAVRAAKDYLNQALRLSDRLSVGQGTGPVHHFHGWW
jgi:hydroxymethylpyrimidine/phosphomethylpyrimidine kinase